MGFWDAVGQAFGAGGSSGVAINPGVLALPKKSAKPKDAPPPPAAPPAAPAAPQWGDLLSHQVFYNQIVVPYLEMLGNRMNNIGTQYGQQMQQYLPHVPAAYRGVLAAGIPQRQADIGQQAAGLQASAVSGPVLDTLMNQINAALTEQTRAAVAGSSGGLLGGLTGLLSPDQQKKVAEQLGGAPAK